MVWEKAGLTLGECLDEFENRLQLNKCESMDG